MLTKLFGRGSSAAAQDQRSSLKQLRECFRKDVIGDKKSAGFSTFWRAVRLYAQDNSISLSKAPASRSLAELQPAYDFVMSLLHDQPQARDVFQGNGTAAIATPVPQLHELVQSFVDRVSAAPVRCHLCGFFCPCGVRSEFRALEAG